MNTPQMLSKRLEGCMVTYVVSNEPTLDGVYDLIIGFDDGTVLQISEQHPEGCFGVRVTP